MMYSVEIGKNIVNLRSANGMSQEALAFDAQVSVSRLRDIEHGVANASIDILESISVALGVEFPVLFLLSMEEVEIFTMLHNARQHFAQIQKVSV